MARKNITDNILSFSSGPELYVNTIIITIQIIITSCHSVSISSDWKTQELAILMILTWYNLKHFFLTMPVQSSLSVTQWTFKINFVVTTPSLCQGPTRLFRKTHFTTLMFFTLAWLQINLTYPTVQEAILSKHASTTDRLSDTRLPQSPQRR